MRRGLVLVLPAALALASAGCNSHDCDGIVTVVDAGTVPASSNLWSEGDRLVLQTSSWSGPWLDFRGSSELQINYPPGFSDPYDWQVWVSTSQYQGPDASFTLTSTSGQLDEVPAQTSTSITFLNATCAEYYMRAVLYARAPDAGKADAAATSDARTD